MSEIFVFGPPRRMRAAQVAGLPDQPRDPALQASRHVRPGGRASELTQAKKRALCLAPCEVLPRRRR